MTTDAISLANIMTSKIREMEDPTEEWRLMVYDHKELIINRSTLVIMDADTLNEFLYRPGEFLYEKHGIENAYTWVFLMINNLATKMDFDLSITEVYVPDKTQINELRSTYSAILAYRKKNS